MAKLTNAMREQIFTKWCDSVWRPKWMDFAKHCVAKVRETIDDTYIEKRFDAETVKKLREDGVVSSQDTLSLGYGLYDLCKSVKMFKKESDYTRVCWIEGNAKLSVRPFFRYTQKSPDVTYPDALVKEAEALSKECHSQRERLWDVLHSVTTDVRLIELLPEIEKYIPKNPTTIAGGLVPIDELKAINDFL